MRVSPKVPLNSCSRSNYGRLPTMTVAATPSSSSDPTLQLGTAFFRHGNAVVEIRFNKGLAGHFFPACGANPLVSLDFCEYAYTECHRYPSRRVIVCSFPQQPRSRVLFKRSNDVCDVLGCVHLVFCTTVFGLSGDRKRWRHS